jgi:hypothetical protein
MNNIFTFGYHTNVNNNLRGPWWETLWMDDDGLEKFYEFKHQGLKKYIVSNNLPMYDRARLDALYKE